ncbi:MAG TPA: L-serine ammonia-lyase, iron-sulfur-dependent, subunit alpha [Clostridia bacterium]|nr:L-serine ammonia-lyase, iron-sulfur-dependent, subunit alpha [Clostridia bacterium]
MNKALYNNHLSILKSNLQLALGCTEPIAAAYAAAKARAVLGVEPNHLTIDCSGNIIKNVNGVVVPNSNGMKGVDVAAVLGLVGGDASRQLEVLEDITEADIEKTKALIAQGFCTCRLVEDVENLYIRVLLETDEGHSAEVVMRDYHTNITRIEKDGEILLDSTAETKNGERSSAEGNPSLLNIENILDFAASVKQEDVSELIERQILCNSALSQEGLNHPWGVQMGSTLLAACGDSLHVRARAAAAAGSDARMSGCTLPAVINSGSGNQGITVTMPVVVYAQALGVEHEQLIRALVVGNLISVHQKKYIGSLSAYCGAVSAATGAACGIAWMTGESYQVICDTIINSIATSGGVVCDGAKPSCAAKISTAVEMALNALELAKLGRVFQPGEGIVKKDAEATIQSVGRMAKDGMRSTDVEILNIMLERV